MDGIEFSSFYCKRFQHNQTIISRCTLERLPIRFCTKDVTDEQMQQIVQDADKRLMIDKRLMPNNQEHISERLEIELVYVCRKLNIPQYNRLI